MLPVILGLAIKDPLSYVYAHYTQPCTTPASGLSVQLEHGIALHQKNNFTQAIIAYENALKEVPEISRLLLHLASSYAANNEHEKAIHYYLCALNLEPRFIAGYIALGMSYIHCKRYQDAIKHLTIACTISPDNADAHLQLSKALMYCHNYTQALAHAHKAHELQPTNIHTLLNLGHIHNKQGTLDDAVTWYTKALALNPHFANAHYNLGYTLRIMKKPHEALKHLLEAERLQLHYVDAHIALAQTYWGMQDYENAWKEYEWRWKLLGINPHGMGAPLWDGCDLHGKTILLYCEQGLGDTVQFIRYAKMVKERGGHVLVKIQKPLLSLLKSYAYVDSYITDSGQIDDRKIDYQAPLLSLPRIFKTTATTIPTSIPYLYADPHLISFWEKKLARMEEKLHKNHIRIGLCWHVDPEHERDKSPWSKRSIDVSLFAGLADIRHASFFSLQKINGEDQLKNISDNFIVHTFGHNFDEAHGRFMDTAAVIANLDLIITVDTSIAHIAAAMGKKVFMLLPYSPDPRWHDEGDTTKWYPSMRLFRQKRFDEWQAVINEVADALKEMAQPAKEVKMCVEKLQSSSRCERAL
jgi:tetratricopeptide (TPR) repeat protein